MKEYILFILILMVCYACSFNLNQFKVNLDRAEKPSNVARIAFGSCAGQNDKQPILNEVVKTNPDLFIYLGDNIYGDTENMKLLAKKYKKLARKKEFKSLVKSTHVLATWDDHDYGKNDVGRYYPQKEKSKEIFLEFFNEPKNSERRKHKGIYHSEIFKSGKDKKVQIILLDTRTFRDDLLKNDKLNGHKNDYRPNPSPDSTFLGLEQWSWLKQQFLKEADVRIVASSNQFSHEYNGWESWTNVPREQEKMLELIRGTQAKGIVFISGDVHWGEISKRENEGNYPIYDVTSSGITKTWSSVEPNKNRIGDPERKINFGVIEINWIEKNPFLQLTVRNVKGESTISHKVYLSELEF